MKKLLYLPLLQGGKVGLTIDVHVRMNGGLPLDTVHARATTIEGKLKERFGAQTHVTLHMEPIRSEIERQ